MKVRPNLNLNISFYYYCTKPIWMYSFVEACRACCFLVFDERADLLVGGSHPCSNLLSLACTCSSAKFRRLLAIHFYPSYHSSLLAPCTIYRKTSLASCRYFIIIDSASQSNYLERVLLCTQGNHIRSIISMHANSMVEHSQRLFIPRSSNFYVDTPEKINNQL